MIVISLLFIRPLQLSSFLILPGQKCKGMISLLSLKTQALRFYLRHRMNRQENLHATLPNALSIHPYLQTYHKVYLDLSNFQILLL